jgi:hypothetical protein
MSGHGTAPGSMADLEALRRLLQDGQRRSVQGSYGRRSPAKEAVPYLLEARSGLRRYVDAVQEDAAGWRAREQVEECPLNNAGARKCL